MIRESRLDRRKSLQVMPDTSPGRRIEDMTRTVKYMLILGLPMTIILGLYLALIIATRDAAWVTTIEPYIPLRSP